MKYIIGIDPGLPHAGIAVYNSKTKSKDFTSKNTKLFLFETKLSDDDMTRYRKLREFFDKFFVEYPPSFVFVEDVDVRPGISRIAQAKLYASLVIILTSLPLEVGYYRVNKVQAKKVLNYMTKSKKALSKKDTHKRLLKEYPFLLRYAKKYGARYEHMLDAFMIMKAGLKMIELKKAYL